MDSTAANKRTRKLLDADFMRRARTALLIAPVVLVVVAVGPPLFDVALAVIGVVAALELQHMVRPAVPAGRVLTASLIVACLVGLAFDLVALIPLAALLLAAAGVWDARAARGLQRAFYLRCYAILIVGALYIGAGLAALDLIRSAADGLALTVMLLLNNWGTDIFALVGGRIAGRHKLAPRISPKKTVEGAAIGLVVGALAGTVVGIVYLGLAPLTAVVVNVLIALSVEIGDLIESWMKRRLLVKDSGHILPGHGGFLDRIDGTLLASMCLYALLPVL